MACPAVYFFCWLTGKKAIALRWLDGDSAGRARRVPKARPEAGLSDPGLDQIVFNAGVTGTISLATTIDITDDVTIVAPARAW